MLELSYKCSFHFVMSYVYGMKATFVNYIYYLVCLTRKRKCMNVTYNFAKNFRIQLNINKAKKAAGYRP